jgi:hypothetical protein
MFLRNEPIFVLVCRVRTCVSARLGTDVRVRPRQGGIIFMFLRNEPIFALGCRVRTCVSARLGACSQPSWSARP